MNRTATNGEFPLTEGVEHAQLLADRTRGKVLAMGTLAF